MPNITVGWQWVIGVLSNLTFAALNALYASKRDKFDLKMSEVKKRHDEDNKKMIQSIINTDFENMQKVNQNEFYSEFYDWLENKTMEYFNSISAKNITDKLKQFHNGVVQNELKLKNVIVEYSNSLNTMKTIINGVLNDTNANKKILFQQSEEIMNNSINPSFQLLDDTKKNISEVKKLIDDIHFK